MKLFTLFRVCCVLAVLALIPATTPPAEAVCICDYTFPVVTPNYLGTGDTCQLAQAHLDGQIKTYADNFCAPARSCGVYSIYTSNCYYSTSTMKWHIQGHGTFSCVEC